MKIKIRIKPKTDWRTRFAFFPTKTADGFWVWLGFYYVKTFSIRKEEIPPDNVPRLSKIPKPIKAAYIHQRLTIKVSNWLETTHYDFKHITNRL